MITLSYDLNLELPLLKDNIVLENLPSVQNGKQAYHTYLKIPKVINPQLLEFLAAKRIFPDHCELFYSPPNFFSGIHVDVNHGDLTKINWVFGGKDSVMNWYSPKVEKKETINSAVNTPYIGYYQNEVDLIHSCNLGFPSLVQVGIPHNIKNFNEHRFCISLVMTMRDYSNKLYRPTMEQSIAIFNV